LPSFAAGPCNIFPSGTNSFCNFLNSQRIEKYAEK